MIEFFLLLVLAILSIRNFMHNRRAEMLFCLTMIYNGLFGFALIFGESLIKPQDVFIVTIYVILYLAFKKNKHLFSLKKDPLGKSVIWSFLWTFLIFIGTILLRRETPLYAFKAYRLYLTLPFFFVLRRMSMADFNRYFRLVFWFSIIQGVFFYLQLVGITGILSGYGSELKAGETLEEHRFGNYPSMAIFFFLFYLLKDGLPLPKRILNIIFWGMMPVIGQMRGATLMLGISVLIYFIIHRNAKNIIIALLGFLVVQSVVAPMFEKREKGGSVSTIEEIRLVLTDPLSAYENYSTHNITGTFTFRIAMLTERIQFLLDNPKLLITGVGTLHEDSPNQRYMFNIGTEGEDEEGNPERGMLSSADIVWVGIVMRFGLVGVILFTMIYLNWIRFGLMNVKTCKNKVFSVCAIMSVGEYLSSFNYDSWGQIGNMMTLLIVIAVVSVYCRTSHRAVKQKSLQRKNC